LDEVEQLVFEHSDAFNQCIVDTVNDQAFGFLRSAIESAVSGLGVCIAPEHLVRSDTDAGRLVAPFGFQASGYTYVVRVHGRGAQKTRDFVLWLQAEIASRAV
jgi:LysR family glycine cleavage system transcriptional activator